MKLEHYITLKILLNVMDFEVFQLIDYILIESVYASLSMALLHVSHLVAMGAFFAGSSQAIRYSLNYLVMRN